MNRSHVLYHLARADFLERVRRYSFLVTLGLVLFLGYQAVIGNIQVRVDNYRGQFNSAWVGSMMAIIASFFLGWIGFYLVKGSVNRDRATGVGQIMATTPLTRLLYLFGKWLSNFAVLLAMLVILALAGAFIQFYAGESPQLELSRLLAPFLFIALPMLALTAAVAVLFETIGFLSGSLGNVIYFFLFIMIFPAFGDTLSKTNPAFEPLGFGLLEQSMGVAAKAAFPDFQGGIMIGSTDSPLKGIFVWSGVDWTPEIILKRLSFFAIALGVVFLASLFFDRFDPSRARPRSLSMKKKASGIQPPQPLAVAPVPAASAQVRLTPLAASREAFKFGNALSSELKLLLKGQRWWWYAIAAGLLVAALVSPPETVRLTILPLTWLWPMLIWSGMGNREIQNNTYQMVFSSAAPLRHQLPAAWLAGFLVAVLTGSAAGLKLLIAGDLTGLLAWTSAALFIPSLALALGVWSNSRKVFEVLYVMIFYLAMNNVEVVDIYGAHSSGNVGFFLPVTLGLIGFAFLGRARQIQN
jgi:ABC-type transport system involved in multi-copper enzyme maturation permease subunit